MRIARAGKNLVYLVVAPPAAHQTMLAWLSGLLLATGWQYTETKEPKEAIGHVQAEVIAVPLQKLIECRLIDPGFAGNFVDAQTAGLCGSAEDFGQAARVVGGRLCGSHIS